MSDMTWRLSQALGALVLLLVALQGCGGDERVEAVPSGEEATQVRVPSSVSENAVPRQSPASPATESEQALLHGSRDIAVEEPAREGRSENSGGQYATIVPSVPAAPCSDDVATCEPRDVGSFDLFSGSGGHGAAYSIAEASSVEEVLEQGLRSAGASPVHIALRGTASADSVRCGWRGIARTAEQRADAIRYWLGLDVDEAVPDPSYAVLVVSVTLSPSITFCRRLVVVVMVVPAPWLTSHRHGR